MYKPKPCPFCEGKPEIKQDDIYFYIVCVNPLCSIHVQTSNWVTKTLAIKAWNKRIPILSITNKNALRNTIKSMERLLNDKV